MFVYESITKKNIQACIGKAATRRACVTGSAVRAMRSASPLPPPPCADGGLSRARLSTSSKSAISAGVLTSKLRFATPACGSEQQHVVILVRKKGLSQLDQDNMWLSWYEIRACLDSIRITCG